METVVILGWMILILLPVVGCLVIHGINSKLNELHRAIRSTELAQQAVNVKRKPIMSKSDKQKFTKAFTITKGKVLKFTK